MQNLKNDGKFIEYTATAAKSAGDIVHLGGGYIGVCVADIALNATGLVQVVGLFTMTKTSTAMTQGQQVRITTTVNTLSAATTSGTLIVNGRVAKAAGTATTSVEFKLWG